MQLNGADYISMFVDQLDVLGNRPLHELNDVTDAWGIDRTAETQRVFDEFWLARSIAA